MTCAAVAIIPFFINSLTTSAVFSDILLASSETTIVSGIMTSLTCLVVGVETSDCNFTFSLLRLIDASERNLTFSLSRALAIVSLLSLFLWNFLIPNHLLTY